MKNEVNFKYLPAIGHSDKVFPKNLRNNTVMHTYKTKLKVNNKQHTQLLRMAGVARFIYNLTLELEQDSYKNKGTFLSDQDIRKIITLRKKEDLSWLNDYNCDIAKQAVKDACKAYKAFFNKIRKKPKFKSAKHSRPSFYIDGWKLSIKNGYIKFPKCTKIRLYEKNYIPDGLNYQNPRITFDGINWWLSVSLKENYNKIQLTSTIIGIDVGLKTLAVCSNGIIFENITKSNRYKKLEKIIKQKQKQISRKYEQNKQGTKFVKTRNIEKLEKKLQKKKIQQRNIKLDYYHKSSTALVRTKPRAIVLEDLNIMGLLKDKRLSRILHSTSITTFMKILINKATMNEINVIKADRFYPSSQLCSSCGYKQHIGLSERTYICPRCGLVLDRDLNAAINLQHYPQFEGKLSLWRANKTEVANSETEFNEEGISHKDLSFIS